MLELEYPISRETRWAERREGAPGNTCKFMVMMNIKNVCIFSGHGEFCVWNMCLQEKFQNRNDWKTTAQS